jgi:hypothetical protein
VFRKKITYGQSPVGEVDIIGPRLTTVRDSVAREAQRGLKADRVVRIGRKENVAPKKNTFFTGRLNVRDIYFIDRTRRT